MKQYIDKDALVAEIENIKSIEFNGRNSSDTYACMALDMVKDVIDTLEVKEVDLEEKATQLSQKYFPDEENIWARANIEARKCKSACIEMVEWLKAQKGE